MKQVPMTTIFNGIFWVNIVGILVVIATLILWPGVDFSDVGVKERSFWEFVVGALFSCPWLPLRKRGLVRPPIAGNEMYARLGGVVAGALQTFR